MKKFVFFLIYLFLPCVIFASKIEVEWKKSFGGNGDDMFNDVVIVPDGGYVAIGESDSTDIDGFEYNEEVNDFGFIVKYDTNGNVLWKRNYKYGKYNTFTDIKVLSDNSLLVVGYAYVNDEKYISFLLKYDQNGNLFDEKKYERDISICFNSISENSDGEFYIAGNKEISNSNKDAFVMKIDQNGNLLWERDWDETEDDDFAKVLPLSDGSYTVVGFTSIDYGANGILIKFDSLGNIIWQKSYAEFDYYNYFLDMILSSDNCYVVTGFYFDDRTNLMTPVGFVLKYDQNGDVIWYSDLGKDSSTAFNSVKELFDGNYLLIGEGDIDDESVASYGTLDGLYAKYDKDGNFIEFNTIGGSEIDQLCGGDVGVNGEGIIVGYVRSEDVEGIENYEKEEGLIFKIYEKYNIVIKESNKGSAIVNQSGNTGMLQINPNEKYSVDDVIIKDETGKELEVQKDENGIFIFDLMDNLTVEIIYGDKVNNPKTGFIDVITILFIGFLISISGFYLVKQYNENYEI